MSPEGQEAQEPVNPVSPPTEPPPVGQVPPPPPGTRIAIGFQAGSIPPQFFEKVTPEHISSMLQLQDNESKRQHDIAVKQIDARERDRRNQREVDGGREKNLFYFAGGVLFFVVIVSWILLSYGQAELIKFMIPAILSFGGGFAAGMGYQRSRQ